MGPLELVYYATSWGSFMNDWDAGACMYGFCHSIEPQNEGHRQACLDWIKENCMPKVKTSPEDFDEDELDKLQELYNAIKNAKVKE